MERSNIYFRGDGIKISLGLFKQTGHVQKSGSVILGPDLETRDDANMYVRNGLL